MENTYVRASSPYLVLLFVVSPSPLLAHSGVFDRERADSRTYAFPLKCCRFQLAFGNCTIRGIMIIDDFPESAKLSVDNLYAVRNSGRDTMCDCICTHPPMVPLSRVITNSNTRKFSWAVIPENRKWSSTATVAFNVFNKFLNGAQHFLNFY